MLLGCLAAMLFCCEAPDLLTSASVFHFQVFFICSHFLSGLQVQRVLKVLEEPFSSQPGLKFPAWVGADAEATQGERDEGAEPPPEGASTSTAKNPVPYDSKPPAWANEICVT